jgi:putative protein kinase ArgK-like GTPase of G3E family
VAFQKILKAFDKYKNTGKKQVVIIEGGPGTGKSVIAVNLLQRVIKEGRMAAYVTKMQLPGMSSTENSLMEEWGQRMFMHCLRVPLSSATYHQISLTC